LYQGTTLSRAVTSAFWIRALAPEETLQGLKPGANGVSLRHG